MERSTYTVTHHGLLIGLYGKTLEEHLREYGLDIFANAIMRYAHERGQRMRKRAVETDAGLIMRHFYPMANSKSPQVLRTTVLAASPLFIRSAATAACGRKAGPDMVWNATAHCTADM